MPEDKSSADSKKCRQAPNLANQFHSFPTIPKCGLVPKLKLQPT